MQKIVAIVSNGRLLHFNYHYDSVDKAEELSKQDLMDFVDTDIPLYYEGEKMTVNDYLGENNCFSARVAMSSYNPL